MTAEKFRRLIAIHRLVEESNLAIMEVKISIVMLDRALERYERVIDSTEDPDKRAVRIGILHHQRNVRSLLGVELLRERQNRRLLIDESKKIAQESLLWKPL